MTDTTIPATLPVFERCPCGTLGRWVAPDLKPNAVLEVIEGLRAEVERLKSEKQEQSLQALSDDGQWIEHTGKLQAEVSRLTAERDAAREDARRLRDAGAPMANTMFNLAQRETMPIRERALLKDMQIRWDAAMNPSTQEPK